VIGGSCEGFIKIHLAVDVVTGQIISLKISDEKVGDNKKFRPLIRKAKQKVSIAKVHGDDGYDLRASFRYLANQNIEPVIKVHKNSLFRFRGCFVRRQAVVFQLKEPDWKAQVGYGARWRVEAAFSCLKRCFGEYVCATKWVNMVNELILKANLYNLFMNLNSQ
jgi:hypothetical protein